MQQRICKCAISQTAKIPITVLEDFSKSATSLLTIV